MRIRAKGTMGKQVSEDGYPVLNGMSPSICDVELFYDDGTPMPALLCEGITIEIPGDGSPIVATVKHIVEEIDVQCVCKEKEGEDG